MQTTILDFFQMGQIKIIMEISNKILINQVKHNVQAVSPDDHISSHDTKYLKVV